MALIGNNGGLIGVKRSTNTQSGIGVWTSVEQAIAVRSGAWPSPSPIPALNPLLWFDFADQSTVTTTSSQVSVITDKGSAGRNLTKSTTGPTYATGINGLYCCDWGSSPHGNYLRNTITTSLSISEIYFILKAGFGSTFPDYSGLWGANTGPYNLTGQPYTSSFYTGGSSYNAAYVNNSSINTYTSILPSINSACLLRINNTSSSASTTSNGIQIGCDRDIGGRGWYGLMGEIVCFSSVLSSTDRNKVQTFLASKWGITIA